MNNNTQQFQGMLNGTGADFIKYTYRPTGMDENSIESNVRQTRMAPDNINMEGILTRTGVHFINVEGIPVRTGSDCIDAKGILVGTRADCIKAKGVPVRTGANCINVKGVLVGTGADCIKAKGVLVGTGVDSIKRRGVLVGTGVHFIKRRGVLVGTGVHFIKFHDIQSFSCHTATDGRLTAIQTSFRNAMLARAVALSNMSTSTGDVETEKPSAKMYASHFIQAFDNGVKRGTYVKAHRAHYGLPVNGKTVPRMSTEQEILQVTNNIVSGDATRVLAGGAAMSNPTAVEVAAAMTTFDTDNSAQSNLKDDYDNAQQLVESLRTEADAVIKKVWDEVETFYNEETPSSKRRKAREWGVIYVSDVQINFEFTIVNNAGSAPIEGVNGELTQTGNEKVSDVNGILEMTSNITGTATFLFTHPDFVDKEITMDLPDGETEFAQEVRMDHV